MNFNQLGNSTGNSRYCRIIVDLCPAGVSPAIAGAAPGRGGGLEPLGSERLVALWNLDVRYLALFTLERLKQKDYTYILYIYTYVYIVYLFVCLFVCLFACLFVCLFIFGGETQNWNTYVGSKR